MLYMLHMLSLGVGGLFYRVNLPINIPTSSRSAFLLAKKSETVLKSYVLQSTCICYNIHYVKSLQGTAPFDLT